MKKLLSTLVVGILIISGLGAVAINNYNEKSELKRTDNRGNVYTHTIIGEFGTATWCYYCQFAHGALTNIYGNSWHPFYYVTLVCDVNVHAEQRAISEMGLTGYPTVYFDGGFLSDVGAGSIPGAQAAYNTSILSCGERDVSDVDINLEVTWNGDAEMYIEVSVDNNEASAYSGHLHVYVCEIVSSMGWDDYVDIPYTFPFLDYAFNQGISVSAGGTWSDSITWDGHDYNNGYGDDFGSISYGNIIVIGTVFDSSTNHADDTTGFRVGNNDAPNAPSNPDPEDGGTNIDTEANISWVCSDPNNDILSYDIYFGESSDPPLVESDTVSTTYNPGSLDLETKYYWKIVATDSQGALTSGPIWSFTTRGNDAPNTPSNPDPNDEETGVYINTDVSWTGGDPDGDDVTYDVYFGTSPSPPLVSENQSSTSYDPSGILDFETTYYWKIVAWDEFDESSTGPTWSFTTEENLPPNTPSSPDPEDGATDVAIDDIIKCTGGDPNPGDIIKYDIYFGTSNPPPLVKEDSSQAAYDPGTMNVNTTYYWQVNSEDSEGLTATGPIWHFTTELEPNDPPGEPTIDGPISGNPGKTYSYTLTAFDTDGDDIRFIIDWGDTDTETTAYISSGGYTTVSHTWTSAGSYVITVNAQDIKGAIGPEETLSITIKKSKTINTQFFRFLQKYLELFPFLQIFLQKLRI
ncbi:hypothetical protein AYK24_03815 [Thermoplasmatales archaeon SG8-52-4]|nr:MAG: hypothetical protein AYK24_03815 [Thermoplasmatales archaeon SG8-52-4]